MSDFPDLTPAEQRELVVDVARRHLAQTTGLALESIELLGEPAVDLEADPVTFDWFDGTHVDFPREIFAAVVGKILDARARRRRALN